MTDADVVKLYCGVYEEATVFPVQIARDAEVSALQKAIVKEKKEVNDRFKVDPAQIALYLARKDGEWLSGGQDVEDMLRGEVDTSYPKMFTWWKLNKVGLLGPDFTPGEEEIQVLVKLPEAATRPEMVGECMGEMQHVHVKQAKRKRYAHSELSSTKGKALMHELGISIEETERIPFGAGHPTPVQAFRWDTVHDESGQSIRLTEEQQRERYRKYIEENIGDVLARKRLCVLGVEKGQNILSASIPGHNIDLVGRTDMLILSDSTRLFPDYLDILPNVRLLIEVKRNIKHGSIFQAVSELIALDVLVHAPVMALLTDMTGRWQFFWVSDRRGSHTIIKSVCFTDPSEGFAVIKALLEQPQSADEQSADAGISLPGFDGPVKRHKLVDVLPALDEAHEGNSLRAAIERYNDIKSVLGPDIDMARAVADQVMRSIPVFANRPLDYCGTCSLIGSNCLPQCSNYPETNHPSTTR